jgi:hypothetical protein
MARRSVPSFLLLMPAVLLAVPAGPAAAREVSAGVVVRASSSGQDAAVYRVEVRNGTPAPVDLLVRQSVPRGASVAATTPGGAVTPGEVNWALRVEARRTTAVRATFAGTGDTFAAACAYGVPDAAPVSCASAAWSAPRSPVALGPWWRSWPVGALAAVVVVLVVVLVVVVRHRRSASAASAASAVRRGPPLWTVFLLATAALVGLLAAGAVAAAPRLTSLVGAGPSDGDGWVGSAPSGSVGQPLADNAFTFIAYRLSCAPAPGGAGSRCVAVIGATNRSSAQERWHGVLQRLATSDGGWAPVDDAQTAAANGGRDVFAGTLQPGGKVLGQLVFTVPAGRAATELELRSGAFADGVRVVI